MDAANTDSAKTIAKMSEQGHIFHLLRGIPRNDECTVFLELILDKNATMIATPNEIVDTLVEKEASIKTENGLAPDALLFARKRGNGGGNGGKAGKGGKSPRRDKRDNKDHRKEKDFRKCFHCQWREHTTENCFSKQLGDPPKSADTTATGSTEASASSTFTTSIKNYWIVANSSASSTDWFIDCGCTTHISGRRSMLITYTEYHRNTKKVKGNNGVTSFASGYGNVRLTCQLPDGRTESRIPQEVVHFPGSFNLISQSQTMEKDVKVEPVNHYGVNLYNRHGKSIVTAPQVNGLFVLDRVLDRAVGSTEYTDFNNDSCLLAHKTTGHASCHDAEKRMLWHHHLPHVGLKALEILPKVLADAQTMTGTCDCRSCIKCELMSKPFTPNSTYLVTEPLQLAHSDIFVSLETAIAGVRYMLLFIDDATRHTDEYILEYTSEAIEKFKECRARREKESGKQVKRFRTDGGREYTSKKFAEYQKSEGIIKELTTPYSPQAAGVVKRANHTMMERVRCILDDAGLWKMHWAFAVSVAVYLENRTLTRSVVGKTPYEAWHWSKPSLKHLGVFRCLAFIHVPKQKRKKLDSRATPGRYVGYSISTKQYFIYNPLTTTLHRTRDVVF